MQSGFNTNFRYRGVLFHVQTEDSGLENPHVITHLFHGGNIMASEKRDYSELIAEHAGEGLELAVRRLMEGQHKAMLRQLSRGEHDPAIEQRMGPDVFHSHTARELPEPQATTEEQPPAPLTPPISAPPPAPLTPPTATATARPTASSSRAPGSATSKAMAEPTRLESDSARLPDEQAGGERSAAEQAQPAASRLARVFGERVASEKPLDEMVLDYLVENARNKRKRTGK